MPSDSVKLSLIRMEKSKKVVIDSTKFLEDATGGEVQLELETFSGWHHCYYKQGSVSANVSGADEFYSSGSIGVETSFGEVHLSRLKCEDIDTLAPSYSPLPTQFPTVEPTVEHPTSYPTSNPTVLPSTLPSSSPSFSPSSTPTSQPTIVPTVGPTP